MKTTTDPGSTNRSASISRSSASGLRSSVRSGVTPQNSESVPATCGCAVAANTGADGRSADSSLAVFPSRVTATMASACPAVASVTAASHSARPCRLPIGSDGGHEPLGRRRQLGILDDRGQRLHRAHGERADCRLPCQHDRVGSLVDGIRGVAHFGACWPRLDAHRLQHLRRENGRTPRRVARAG